MTRPKKERLTTERLLYMRGSFDAGTCRAHQALAWLPMLFNEIDALTAERDAAQHAEVSLHMRLTKLTAERDEARKLASAYVHMFDARSSADERRQMADLALVNSWHRPEEKS